MKTIRYGILGLGVIGDRFARVVRTVEGSALAAVAARDLGRAAQFAARHGGALYDVGVYVAEFANGVLDALPVAVKAVSTLSPTGVDEYTALSLRYQDGALASLACGIRGAAPTDALIVGTGGRIVVRDFFQSRRCELLGPDGETVEVYESGYDDGFRFQIEHFAEMVRTGTPESTVMPWRDTIGCADLFDEVRAQCGMA